MKPVIVAGHVCLDLTPRFLASPELDPGRLIEVGPFSVAAGGCVGNTGGALAGLGVPTRFAGCIGTDELGDVLVALLERSGGDVGGLRRRSDVTTSCSLVIETPGRDRTFWHHVGANALFDGTDVVIEDASLLHVGYPTHLPGLTANGAAPLRALLERARRAGVTTSVDLARLDADSPGARIAWPRLLHELLPLVDVVSPSADDLRSVLPGRDLDARGWAELLVGWGAAVAMVTAGEAGLTIRTGSRARLAAAGATLARLGAGWSDAGLAVPSMNVPVVTTTGAGDAATAGLLAAIVDGRTVGDAAGLAVATAAAKISAAPFRRARETAGESGAGFARPAASTDGPDAPDEPERSR